MVEYPTYIHTILSYIQPLFSTDKPNSSNNFEFKFHDFHNVLYIYRDQSLWLIGIFVGKYIYARFYKFDIKLITGDFKNEIASF